MHLQHGSSPFLLLASHFTTFWLGHEQKSKFWFLEFFFAFPFFPFCYSDWPSTGLACSQKTSKKASSRQAIFTMEQLGAVEILVLVFRSTFWAFLCISQVPFGRSLWSGHHWKDLFLLQKSNIDDANFVQKWWRQKWKKGQGSSRPVTGGTGVNGLSGKILFPWQNALYYQSFYSASIKFTLCFCKERSVFCHR